MTDDYVTKVPHLSLLFDVLPLFLLIRVWSSEVNEPRKWILHQNFRKVVLRLQDLPHLRRLLHLRAGQAKSLMVRTIVSFVARRRTATSLCPVIKAFWSRNPHLIKTLMIHSLRHRSSIWSAMSRSAWEELPSRKAFFGTRLTGNLTCAIVPSWTR